jgi:hypothetical protein
MSAASEFIKNKPVLSYMLLLATVSIIFIVVVAILAGNIDEKIPTKEFIDSRIDAKITKYDSIVTERNKLQYDTIISSLRDIKKKINE